MPSDGSGHGGGGRVPLRGFTNLLKHLAPAERDRLASAFAEAENTLDFHTRTNIDKTTRRRISGLVQIPILKVAVGILGATVRWDRLDDPRIQMYELNIDNTNTFPNPEVLTVLDPFFTLENINSVKFVRVRGVRVDGLTGNWSETARIQPTITAPKIHTSGFYQEYMGGDPSLVKHKRFGGEDTPGFYTLFADRFYADRLTGGFSVWGYISNRLKEFRDSPERPWDRVKFKVNGIDRMDNYFPHWTDSFPDDGSPLGNESTNPQRNPNTGKPMSFYSRGGYTASFGPYGVELPNTLAGEGANDPRSVFQKHATNGIPWACEELIRRPSKYDDGFISNIRAQVYGKEAVAVDIQDNQLTDYIVAHDFNFSVPSDKKITGIEVGVKRRQILAPDESLTADFGKAAINVPLTANFGVGNFRNMNEEEDVAEDVNFGTFADFGPVRGEDMLANADFQTGFPNGDIALTIANDWTISMWVNFADQAQSYSLFTTTDESFPNKNQINISSLINVPSPNHGIIVSVFDITGTIAKRINKIYNNRMPQTGRWYHIAVVKQSLPTDDVLVYLDGTLLVPNNSFVPSNFEGQTDTERRLTIGGVPSSGGTPDLNGKMAQIGVWNTQLPNNAISRIVKASGTADLRGDFGGYEFSDNLQHYWLFFPGASDIRDFEVRLIDEEGTIRTDLDNKAVTTESWPVLSEFIENNQFVDGLPIAVAQGIPHDNLIGIGYQKYGGEQDTWGGSWIGEQVNQFYFGVAIRAKNEPEVFPGTALLDHVKMTLFFQPEGDREIDVAVEAEAVNRFYIEREVFGALFNAIEIGERLVPDLSDC